MNGIDPKLVPVPLPISLLRKTPIMSAHPPGVNSAAPILQDNGEGCCSPGFWVPPDWGGAGAGWTIPAESGCAELEYDEGVEPGAETDSDAVELYQLGCEYAQGFVFGEPMPEEKARELLQPHAKVEMVR